MTPLGDRERQVVALVLEGQTYKAVASLLGLSLSSVKAHARRARKKLGANSTPHMVAILGGVTKDDIPQ